MVLSFHRHHEAVPPGAWSADLILLLPFLLAAIAYLASVAVQRRRGRPWPWYRSMLWMTGLTAAASGFYGPVASWSHATFTGHMASHLLVGMVAPLLLVLAAPVTLALRTLAVAPARKLSRLLNSAPARVLTNPFVAAVLNVGAMWVLYLTPLFDAMQDDLLIHRLVMAHFLVAGYLYTAAFVSIDPSPHRSSFPFRAGVLLLSMAAHGVLAKLLYAYPPEGLNVADVGQGAELMFYGGDAVDFILVWLLCAQWYRYAGQQLHRVNLKSAFDPRGSQLPGHDERK